MRWAAPLALCACNQVFDLAPTIGPDSDRDLVTDGADNCELVANRDQDDEDGDALGDACDPCRDGVQIGVDGDHDGVDDGCDACLAGLNGDEDGDGVLDGCDVCPGHADGSQQDSDGDSVGDACDREPGVQNGRVAFDGFDPPAPHWDTGFVDWVVSDGAYGPPAPLTGRYQGMWNPDLVVPATSWTFEAQVRTGAVPTFSGAHVEVIALTKTGGSTVRDCGVVFMQGQWYVASTTMVVTVGETMTLQLLERPDHVECWIDGTLVKSVTHSLFENETWRPFLQANTTFGFKWLDIVR